MPHKGPSENLQETLSKAWEERWAKDHNFRPRVREWQHKYGRSAKSSHAQAEKLKRLIPLKEILETPFPEPEQFIDNEIHPLFHRDKWFTAPALPLDKAYEQMMPAFRLATKWLTDDEFLGWWTRIYYGKITGSGSETVLERQPEEHLPNPKEVVKERLLEMAEGIKFTFHSDSMRSENSTECWVKDTYQLLHVSMGLAGLEWDDKVARALKMGLQDPKNEKKATRPTITFDLRFLDWFGAMANGQYSPGEKLRVQFYFAHIIVHELAHAWNCVCHPDTDLDEPLVEANDVYRECGYSWATNELGAKKFRFGWSKHNTGPLCAVAAAPYSLTQAYQRNSEILAVLDMPWILQWFLKSTWDNVSELRRTGQLTAPTERGRPRVAIASSAWPLRYYIAFVDGMPVALQVHSHYRRRPEGPEDPDLPTVPDSCTNMQEWWYTTAVPMLNDVLNAGYVCGNGYIRTLVAYIFRRKTRLCQGSTLYLHLSTSTLQLLSTIYPSPAPR